MVQIKKFGKVIKIFLFTLLIWKCHNFYANTYGKSCIKRCILDNALDLRVSRLLYDETDVELERKYVSLKKKAEKIVNEDEYNFGNRLNKLMKICDLAKEYNMPLYYCDAQKSCSSLISKDNFEKSHDSIIYDNYIKHKHLRKSLVMDKYMPKRTNIFSSYYKKFKKMGENFERTIAKLLGLRPDFELGIKLGFDANLLN
ncbi:Plasmodium exported protein, unknown function [Plasmodium malariae]|uniref:Pv-fam-d protein n=1 Tax=Plasmodium malariae TaxID=5858 RepID=A0A1D3JKH7_PLAMA|nr:Plasmodium exported protein, unknown function [Plasmodium malariae]SBT87019.1 Plasmodium exported protein, unknown function [Plasmodium malariae]